MNKIFLRHSDRKLSMGVASRNLRLLGSLLFPRPLKGRKSLANSRGFCSLCGCGAQGVRSIYTTQLLYKKLDRKPIVFKKSKLEIVPIWKNMSVQDLADSLGKSVEEIFEVFLFVDESDRYKNAFSIITNLKVSEKVVNLVGKRYTYRAPELDLNVSSIFKDVFKGPPAPPEDLEPRPPIVTIMGHVDHGKTTLLDCLRQSSIVDTEFGGITQHIGAFDVCLPSGHQVTFLDTPGHAAFSAMRARGANVTDLIVLVVAADDGVLQQTKESAELAKQTDTPIVVAINKIDKSNADVRRCEESLINIGIQTESLGGDVQSVPISALKGTGVSLLVEALVTQAELLDLRATKKGFVEGTIIEAKIDPKIGKIATCVIQRGTLTKGAVLVADTSWAKVRNLFNSSGKPIDKALPGSPVQIIGWRDSLPSAGAEVLEVKNDKKAREVMSVRENEIKKLKQLDDNEVIQKKSDEHLVIYREQLANKRQMGIKYKQYRGRPPLEKLFKDDDSGPSVKLVFKGDVDGSVDAIMDVIGTYHSDECPLDVLSYGVGSVTPNDLEMAQAFNGSIYAFNLEISKDTRELAREKGVTIHEHNIIYRLIEHLKDEISKRLPLKPVEQAIGEAIVQEEFLINEGKKKVPVAGCLCVKGFLKKDHIFRIVRALDVIHEGEIESLRHVKKEVESIKKDVECGIRFKEINFRFEPGDSIICYKTNMVPQRTAWSPDGF